MGAITKAAQPHPLAEAVDPQPTTEAAEPQSTNAAVSSTGGLWGGLWDAELDGFTPKEMQVPIEGDWLTDRQLTQEMAAMALITSPETTNTGPGLNRGPGGGARGRDFEEREGAYAHTEGGHFL